MNRLRAWIDAKEHRPMVASLVIIQTPVIAALWITMTLAGAPWWYVPSAVAGAVVLFGWVCLVVAAMTRWFE